MNKIFALIILIALSASLKAENYNNIYNMAPLTVTEELTSAKATSYNISVASLIDDVPGIIVNSQGSSFLQSDLSIQGSSFSSAGISISGVSIKNPQTEHFNSELPFSSSFFNSAEILTGTDQMKNSSGHLVGTVNLKLDKSAEKNQFSVSAFKNSSDAYTFILTKKLSSLMSLSVAAEKANLNEIDQANNGLNKENISLRLNLPLDPFNIDFLAGRLDKTFGAKGFYGVNSSLPAKETIDDKAFLLLIENKNAYNIFKEFTLSVLYKETADHYNLWLPSFKYANSHESNFTSLSFKGTTTPLFNDKMSLNIQASIEDEDIESSGLGNHNRKRYNLSLLPLIFATNNCNIEAGISLLKREDESLKFMGLFSAAYFINDKNSFSLSLTETTRDPSYTELNYESPGSLGNNNLDYQDSLNIEAGWQSIINNNFKCSLKTFYRKTRDAVDWTKDSDTARWTANNISLIKTKGVETSLSYHTEKLYCDLWLSKLEKTTDDEFYSSRYSLDYPEFYSGLAVLIKPHEKTDLSFKLSYRKQEENLSRTGKSEFINLRSSLTLKINENISVIFKGSNLLDNDFEILPGLPPVNKNLSAELRIKW